MQTGLREATGEDSMDQLQANRVFPKEKVWLIVLWLVSFFIHAAVMNHFVGWICTDTAGYWLHAATFTGYDWSEVAKTTSMYYSWGYSLWLIIPFLIMPGNMVMMAKAAIIINAVFCSLTFVFAYFLGKKIFHMSDKRFVMGCALIVSVYPSYILGTSVALSESLLFFLYVFCLWLIAGYLNSNKRKWAILSGCCCGYMYIVHHRTLGIVAAFLCMLLVLYIKNKDVKEVLYFFIPILICLAISVFVDHWLMEKEMGDCAYTVNTYRSMTKRISSMLRLGRILSMVQNVIGESWYLLTGTFSVAGIGVISICKKIANIQCCGEIGKKADLYSFLYVFAILSFVFSMGISVFTTARSMESTGGRIDVIFYGRYFENTLSFFILAGLVAVKPLRKKWDTCKEAIFLLALIVAGSAAVYYFTKMIPGNGVNYFSVAALLSLYSYPNLEFSVLAVAICHIGVILVFLCLLWMKKRVYTVAAYFLIFVCFVYTGYHAVVNVDQLCRDHALVADYPTQNKDARSVNQYLQERGIACIGVYLENSYDAFSYQLMNPQKKVYAFSSIEDLNHLQGIVTHVIVPQSFKESMAGEELKMETVNYAVYAL